MRVSLFRSLRTLHCISEPDIVFSSATPAYPEQTKRMLKTLSLRSARYVFVLKTFPHNWQSGAPTNARPLLALTFSCPWGISSANLIVNRARFERGKGKEMREGCARGTLILRAMGRKKGPRLHIYLRTPGSCRTLRGVPCPPLFHLSITLCSVMSLYFFTDQNRGEGHATRLALFQSHCVTVHKAADREEAALGHRPAVEEF